ADALRATIAANKLPKSAFENMLEARIFDLYDDPMPSRTDLEGYCGETAAALIQLAAMVLDPAAAPGFAELAGRA
ncbi:squalene/phytoene synthase family protein, partial [Mesorhizobium sp.]